MRRTDGLPQASARRGAKKTKLEAGDNGRAQPIVGRTSRLRHGWTQLLTAVTQDGDTKAKIGLTPKLDLKAKLVRPLVPAAVFAGSPTSQAGIKDSSKVTDVDYRRAFVVPSDSELLRTLSQSEAISTCRSTRLCEKPLEEGDIIEVEEGEIDE